ncbi:MAG: sodium:solute symporter family protein [Planctomycetes bacterium]|nr:sodium:solute symporter family protein [Planctomycetota bacterium]
MLAQTVGTSDITVIVVYLMLVGYLGWLGYRKTSTATDYLLAGRKTHPFVMAMSYGATFISTSAIVGFGGVAGLFGMSLLWLTFLNIFVGIFIAFVFLGEPTRKMGHLLDAHTFPELLGRRFDSKFIQVFSGLVIFLFIPLYAAAVLIGGCEFIATRFGIHYNVALLIFSVLIAAYVVVGGLKAVMYADALQGTIMFVGMLVLILWTYAKVGGVIDGHQALTDLNDLVPAKLAAIGHQGWASTPKFGWGDVGYNLWWIVISTIAMGVGIGVLAQPQLIVRFMTVKSKRELNRAVLIGGVFILVMTGVAFTVGSLSNVYFSQKGPVLTGRSIKTIDAEKGHHVLQLMKQDQAGKWVDIAGKKAPVVLDSEKPYTGETASVDGKQYKIARGRSVSIVYAKGNSAQIIPLYITKAMPGWFGMLFLLTLLAAAMSTLSSQFHAVGTSIGRDVFEQVTRQRGASIGITRIGIVVGIILAVLISSYGRESTMIARATAIFFGLCASAFLPAFVGALFFKRITKAGAISSMIVGFAVTAFWLTFVKAKEAETIGLVQKITDGKTSILAGHPNWPVVDPLIVALPLSILVVIVVSMLTRKPSEEQLAKCFPPSTTSND